MKIHEYQAKELLARHGVPVPRGKVVETAEEAAEVARQLGGPVVIKAQIHAGGRGKAGGIQLAEDPEEALEKARALLGRVLVTAQTGPEGRLVRKVLVEESLPVARELYAGVVFDRSAQKLVLMASPAGGVEIEELAKEHPELIFKEHFLPQDGLLPFQARRLAFKLELNDQLKEAVQLFQALATAFVKLDASLVEVNPLTVTANGRLLALDAKINLDDNGLARHPDLKQLRDIHEEDPLEVEASRYGLNYIKLNGNVGCMVNGAGLAMATMDIIKYVGGEPANFLDVGGGANEEQIRNAFRILVSDKSVKVVLINIFGGILRCDRLARGVVAAAKELELQLPIVVRMEGTNVEEGRRILRESGLNFTVASDMLEAAKKAVELARK